MRFYLGTHLPHWLATAEFPLCVARQRIQGRTAQAAAAAGPRAVCRLRAGAGV